METQTNNETKLCKHCQSEIPKKAKVCPNCRKKQGGIAKWIVIAIVVILIIGLATGDEEVEPSQTQEKTTEKQEIAEKEKEEGKGEKPEEDEPTEEVSYTPYSVSQMMKDLDSNALNAENTYKDQYVEITGVLSNIDSSGKYIGLMPDDNEFAIIGVQCYIMNDEQKNQVVKMSRGDTITLRGKVTMVGEVMGYGLDIDEILQK